MFDIQARTIYQVRAGSHAYGTNTATSDLDVRGVCIPPKAYFLGYLHRFDQHTSLQPVDCTTFGIIKFITLAVDCNPNILELLFVDPVDILLHTKYSDQLLEHRDLFISKKAKHTFSGYAHAQLKRIKTHRNWLLNPPTHKPTREEFGLSQTHAISKEIAGAFEATKTQGININLPEEVLQLFLNEKSYQAALAEFNQYNEWKTNRNPSRAQLELKHGYDTKHGMHLIRLLRMCREILQGQSVIVKRPDADELLAIRHGQKTYDELIQEAETLDTECERLYLSSNIPHTPPKEKIDSFIIQLIDQFLNING